MLTGIFAYIRNRRHFYCYFKNIKTKYGSRMQNRIYIQTWYPKGLNKWDEWRNLFYPVCGMTFASMQNLSVWHSLGSNFLNSRRVFTLGFKHWKSRLKHLYFLQPRARALLCLLKIYVGGLRITDGNFSSLFEDRGFGKSRFVCWETTIRYTQACI